MMNGLTFPSMKTRGDFVSPLIVPNTLFRIPPPVHLDSRVRTFRPKVVLFFDIGDVVVNVLFLKNVVGLALQFVKLSTISAAFGRFSSKEFRERDHRGSAATHAGVLETAWSA